MNAHEITLIAAGEYMGGLENIRSVRRLGWRIVLWRRQGLPLQLGSAR